MHKLEEIRGVTFGVLDHGFIRLLDVMGSDQAIEEAARVSVEGSRTISDTRTLIRFMLSGGYEGKCPHSSPFESCVLKFNIKLPIFVERQWARHRTACLAGDTQLHFDLPGGIERRGNQLYKLSVEEVYERFQPTENKQRPDKQRNPYFRRDRIQGMMLRCVDEETGLVRHTNIVDIWQSGEKLLFKIVLENGKEIRASRDHLFFTTKGWLKLADLERGDEIITVSARRGIPAPSFNQIDADAEEWLPILEWEDYYEISTQGRVRRIVGGQGARSYGRCKKITVCNGRAVTSLNRPGKSVKIHVSREMLRAFIGEPEPGIECCHENGNSLDNRIENLYWGTSQDNKLDAIEHGRTTFLTSQPVKIKNIFSDNMEMTYDIEVAGPWHNFSANGFVVHNSWNEISGRYAELPEEYYVPEPDCIRAQSSFNKQGRDAELEKEIVDQFVFDSKDNAAHEFATYKARLNQGVARELARINLPLSTYTHKIWSCNLWNLLHFLSLRMDSHAQWEIRQYANVIGEKIVAPLFPIVWEAFQDYRLKSVSLSRVDLEMCQKLIDTIVGSLPLDNWEGSPARGLIQREIPNKREAEECVRKLEKVGILQIEIDPPNHPMKEDKCDQKS